MLTFDFPFAPGLSDDDDDDEVVDLSGLLEDDDVSEYRVTVRLFVTSAIVLVVNLIIAAAIYSGAV